MKGVELVREAGTSAFPLRGKTGGTGNWFHRQFQLVVIGLGFSLGTSEKLRAFNVAANTIIRSILNLSILYHATGNSSDIIDGDLIKSSDIIDGDLIIVLGVDGKLDRYNSRLYNF